MDELFSLAEDQPVCRICLDSTPTSPFVSPCACKGSQRYVHLACLRRWQSCVLDGKLMGDHLAEKAYKCSVCLSRYTLPPLKVPAWQLLSNWYRALLAVVCLLLLAVSGGTQAAASSGWHHIILLSLLLLIGARSQPVILITMLAVLGTVGTLYARGLRIVVCMQAVTGGGAWGLALIRSGRPIEHLGPATLLVASRHMSHASFHESVILLLNHSMAQGAQGVVLSQPLEASPHPYLTASDDASQWLATSAVDAANAHATSGQAPPPGVGVGGSVAAGPPVDVRPEQLWADIARRHRASGLLFRRFVGGPVGLASHVAADGSPAGGAHPATVASMPGGRSLFAWLPPIWQQADALTVLHDVPGVPGVHALHTNRATPNAGPTQQHAPPATGAVAPPSDHSESERVNERLAAYRGARRHPLPQAAHQGSSGQDGDDTSPTSGVDGMPGGGEPPLWVGGTPSEVLLRATELLSGAADGACPGAFSGGSSTGPGSAANHASRSRGVACQPGAGGVQHGGAGGAPWRFRVLVFHGKALWAPGQLEGELRSGLWGFAPATKDDLLRAVQPQAPGSASLWSHLVDSGRLTWL